MLYKQLVFVRTNWKMLTKKVCFICILFISSKDSYLFVYGYQKVGYGLINSVHGATGIVTTVYAYFVGVFLSLFVLTSVGQAF